MDKSSKILYSAGMNDENYTPQYAVEPIIKYLPAGKVIWCPFDTKNSEFVLSIPPDEFSFDLGTKRREASREVKRPCQEVNSS